MARLREEAGESLRASEERFRALVSATSDVVYRMSPDWTEMLILHGQEFIPDTHEPTRSWLQKYIPPEDRSHVLTIIREAIRTKSVFELEHRIVRADGTTGWAFSRAVPLLDRSGAIREWFGMAGDITARKRAEEELQAADRRKDEFLATLAHELRNPLAPLRNGLQIMRLSSGEHEVVETARTMMERQLAQLVHLVDDLLDLSRISRGRIELRKQRVELAKVVQQAVETSRPAIEQAGHTLTITVPPAPVYVDADVTRLAQVFSNLLNNAAKYTDRGGRIELAVWRQGVEVLVVVRDTGIGIPAHMLPKVFDIFTQVDRNLERSHSGLGIGLSIVKKLVEMHGGTVEAKSAGHGKGSAFTVRLPIVLSLAPDPDTGANGPGPGQQRRILVVDDNQDAALSLATLLELMGNQTQTAFDGSQALELAPVFRPDLILLDIGMPRLNGYDTARRIREQPWGRCVVLVALTGWGQEEDRRKSQEAGFNYHLTKPVDLARLEKLLADLRADPA
jgi:signal transduction histidine kinase